MFTLPFLLAAGSLPLISGAPVASSLFSSSVDTVASKHSLSGRSTNTYAAVFGGDGLVSDGWPSISEWISDFETMFESNKDVMSSSCSQWSVENPTEEEMGYIKSSIKSVAESTSVDARFILAIVMQESNGCVRVPTTDNGVTNPGLMQSHDGTGTCNSGSEVSTPCIESEIKQMIQDGAGGTSAGAGLQQCLAQYGTDATAYYKAARCYNSGSVDSSGNLGAGGATHCYVSDVANRLLGWSEGTSSCDPDTIGSLTGSSWTGSSSSGSSGSSSGTASTATSTATSTSSTAAEPTDTFTPTTTPSVPVQTGGSEPVTIVPTPTVTATPTATATPSASASGAPLYPYATSSCEQYYTVVKGDYCRKVEVQYGITASQLQGWNPGLDDACTNLWKGYQYCVKA
ncbi:hypothetical protein N7462_009418 [Penicillium macrosclerotiorum]|uniref:uncharacterized protein n=1 Tax=Penicillium macrosclerotiorum TaxID=303699 RepID=UPI002547766E|nr:uncharacterized protein N7462_009418 [Penicillium macrosclerotiorum]KAJ5673979.1 hypothetical protein N7462_009418 [Penicillium macrosclerotiorum]